MKQKKNTCLVESKFPEWIHEYLDVDSFPEGTYYDEVAAEKPIFFAKRLLVHLKAEWAGLPVILEEWQKRIFLLTFGLKTADGLRLIRTVYLEIPRKNGKSLLGTIFGLYGLLCDDEPGAEVYSAAADEKQAKLIFDQACKMIKKSRELKRRCVINKERIVYGDSYWEALTSDASTKDGLNPHFIIFDELHAQKKRDLYDVLRTGCAARRQPLEVYMTTAGKTEDSICYEVRAYGKQVKQGIIKDPTFLAIIYGANPDLAIDNPDYWGDIKTWAACNPNFGSTVKIAYLQGKYNEALANPTMMPTFKRNHLCVWTNESKQWMPPERWRACRRNYDFGELEGECYMGVDLSTHIDLTGIALAFPSNNYTKIRTFCHCFIPQDIILEKTNADKQPYQTWIDQGFITATPGPTIDYDVVEEYIDMILKRFDVREVAIDPWNSNHISTRLRKLGAPMVDFRQTSKMFTPALTDIDGLVANRGLHHNDNPVLNWMMANIKLDEDGKGNKSPNKVKSKKRIDGAMATIMAVARALSYREEKPPSVYEERGIIIL